MSALNLVLLVLGLLLLITSGGIWERISGKGGVRPLGLPFAGINITWEDITNGLLMLVGIVAKEVWDNINETGNVGVRLPKLIQALIVSPIIYAAVYSNLSSGPITLVSAALAFQNGFFWQSVFSTAQAGAGATVSP